MKSRKLLSLLSASVLAILTVSENPQSVVQAAIITAPASSALSALKKTDEDAETVRLHIENTMGIYSDEKLPRGVRKLNFVSIKSSRGRQITVRWAVNDWMQWTSGSQRGSLEEGAKRDIINILEGITRSKVGFATLRLEGTLPMKGVTGEQIVIEVVYKRAAIEECKFDSSDYFEANDRLNELLKELEKKRGRSKPPAKPKKVESPQKKKKLVTISNVLSFAESGRIHPELRKRYL